MSNKNKAQFHSDFTIVKVTQYSQGTNFSILLKKVRLKKNFLLDLLIILKLKQVSNFFTWKRQIRNKTDALQL
jgi:hypothetical protein